MILWWQSIPAVARLRCVLITAWWLIVSYSWISRSVPLYGRSCGDAIPGEIGPGLVILAIEFVVLLAILRPWSYAKSFGRALVALGVFLLVGMFFTTTCADAFASLHSLWLLGIIAGCAAGAGLSAVASLKSSSR